MPNSQAKPQLVVWWILWAALLGAVFILNIFIRGDAEPAEFPKVASTMWLAGLAPFALSTVLRWLVLPRLQTYEEALPCFIIGIALAEATSFAGLFFFKEHHQELWIASIAGVLQYIPTFAGRFYTEGRSNLTN